MTAVLEEIWVPRLGPGRARVRPDRVLADKAYRKRETFDPQFTAQTVGDALVAVALDDLGDADAALQCVRTTTTAPRAAECCIGMPRDITGGMADFTDHRDVDKLIGLGPSNHGTSLDGIIFLRKSFPPLGPAVYSTIEALLPAAIQQTIGSELVKETYAEGDTRPGVTYSTLVTQYDEVNTPYTNQFLSGPGVTNVLLQDGCPDYYADHLGINYSERAWRFVLNALDPEHPNPVPCLPDGFLFPGLN
ncbi:hypothetical protein [Nocardia xishanensis]